MRRGPVGPGVPWWTQIRGLVGDWALAIPMYGYWVGGEEVVPTQYSPPGIPLPVPTLARTTGTARHLHYARH